jgi:glucokinase
MALLGIDLGGTKLALAIISKDGEIIHKETVSIGKRTGKDVGLLITELSGEREVRWKYY